MLTELSLKNGKNLSKALLSQNKFLVPKPGTLLSELYKFSYDSNSLKVENEDLIEDAIAHYSQGKEVENKGIKSYILSDHDSLMDNYITDLTNIFSNQINFARNTVNKLMTEFTEELENSLSSFTPKEPEDFFKVRYYTLPNIFKSELITEIKDTNKSLYALEPLALNTLNFNDFKIEEYVLTSDPELDKVISEFVNDLKERNVLNKYILENIKDYELDIIDLLDYAMINYLFYRALSEKTDLNLGLTVMDLRSRAFNNKIAFANKIKTALDLYDSNLRNGNLLTSTSETKFSILSDKTFNITIYEDNFKLLAEKEVGIEAVFGFIVDSNTSNITVNELINKKDYYVDKWSKLKSLYMLNLTKNKLNIFKQYTKILYDKYLRKVYEEIVSKDEELKIDEKRYIEEANKKFDCFINNVTLEQSEDLIYVSLKVIAESVFWFSNAYELLKEMNDILNTVEDITPQDAAMYSAIKYLTNFMLDQVNVTNI